MKFGKNQRRINLNDSSVFYFTVHQDFYISKILKTTFLTPDYKQPTHVLDRIMWVNQICTKTHQRYASEGPAAKPKPSKLCLRNIDEHLPSNCVVATLPPHATHALLARSPRTWHLTYDPSVPSSWSLLPTPMSLTMVIPCAGDLNGYYMRQCLELVCKTVGHTTRLENKYTFFSFIHLRQKKWCVHLVAHS